MLKITQGSGYWSGCARFQAIDGGNVEGIKIVAGDIKELEG